MDREKEIYLFHQGTYYHAYNFLGCHIVKNKDKNNFKNVKNCNNMLKFDNINQNLSKNSEKESGFCKNIDENVENDENLSKFNNINNNLTNKNSDNYGAWFRCLAPNAKEISLVGDFNGWDFTKHKMSKIDGSGIWEVYAESVKIFDNYKFQILTKDNRILMKADPFAFHSETNGATASKVYAFEKFEWTDKEYYENKFGKNHYELPMNIYEVNLGSWERKPTGEYLSYREMADKLSCYARDMGYTHIEIMPVTEYPFDGSWGYQPTGYFSVTSRFGTPDDFRYFVNKFHEVGIGVILDWTPAHFPKDEHGLIEWDGTYLYENQGWDKIEHKSWGTRRFDYGRGEVQSFLISSATFFIDKFHIDGIRVDAVASMLYLDYDKKQGEWLPNSYGDNKNLEAIAFLQKLNTVVLTEYPNVIMIAEESTAFPLVTKPAFVGGLGFNYKWNIGWMNDSLSYASIDPFFRKDNHDKLTFSMFYAFSENFILPISHDEVVHGKKSLLNKMFGSYEEKFEMLKVFMMYMFAHPGKKLNFMGNEIAQFDEWNNSKGIDFMLLGYEKHNNIFKFSKELNHLYLNSSELYEIDYSWDGFKWLTHSDRNNNVIAFERRNKNGETLVFVANFSPVSFEHYRVGVQEGRYVCVLASNESRFGGSGKITKFVTSEYIEINGFKYSIDISLEPYSAFYFKKQELKLSIVSKFYSEKEKFIFDKILDDSENASCGINYSLSENNKKNTDNINSKNDKNIINKIIKYKIKEKIKFLIKNSQKIDNNNIDINEKCKKLDKLNIILQDNNIFNIDNIKNIEFLDKINGNLESEDMSYYKDLLKLEETTPNFFSSLSKHIILKRGRGRPRKILSDEEINKPKRSRGRPRKILDV